MGRPDPSSQWSWRIQVNRTDLTPAEAALFARPSRMMARGRSRLLPCFRGRPLRGRDTKPHEAGGRTTPRPGASASRLWRQGVGCGRHSQGVQGRFTKRRACVFWERRSKGSAPASFPEILTHVRHGPADRLATVSTASTPKVQLRVGLNCTRSRRPPCRSPRR
jgi:hypothetical protein